MSLILDYIKRHPKETKRLIGITYEQLQQLIVDSAEQPIERPSEYEQQKKFIQKKNHTRKNQFIVMPKGSDIIDVKVGATGPSSDINLFRQQQKKFNPNQKFKGDKAYMELTGLLRLTKNQKNRN